MKKWQTKSVKKLFQTRIFSLIDKDCYHPIKEVNHNFFTIETNDWINVVAETVDNRFIMVKQHRTGTDEFTLETPGGLVEDEEDPEKTVLRELQEETGYVPEKVILLKKLSANPAILNNYIYFYYASGCRCVAEQNLDASEDIEVVLLSKGEVLDMIKDSRINHSIIVTAFLLYFLSAFDSESVLTDKLKIY